MPVISIKSLPFSPSPDIPSVLNRLAEKLSSELDIEIEHFSITWNFLEPGHYSHAGQTLELQPASDHPLLVSILVPDLFPTPLISRFLNLFTEELAISVRVSQENIFVHLSTACSGTVFRMAPSPNGHNLKGTQR